MKEHEYLEAIKQKCSELAFADAERAPYWWLPPMRDALVEVERLRCDCAQALSAAAWDSLVRRCHFVKCESSYVDFRPYKDGSFQDKADFCDAGPETKNQSSQPGGKKWRALEGGETTL